MSMQNYSVYIGTSPVVINIDSDSTMAQVRSALGSNMTSTDNFLYENPITQLKTVLTPTSSEAQAPLSKCQFPAVPSQGVANPVIQVVSTSATSPSFMGTAPTSGYISGGNPYFGVQVSLNQTDPAAVTNNTGMFEPVMLENVTSCNPDNPANFTYAVICQKGAIVQFNISCWGAAGWGYSITAAMGTNICDGLYIVYDGSTGNPYARKGTTSLLRYASQAGDTIQIQANEALNIATQYNVEYSTITVNAWSLNSWERGGKTYSNNTPIPSMEALMADVGGGFHPGPPSGTASIPGGSTLPASPTAGPPSNQQFGQSISNIFPSAQPNTRSGGLVGSMELFFLVFDNEADATAVVKVLNNGTMGFGG